MGIVVPCGRSSCCLGTTCWPQVKQAHVHAFCDLDKPVHGAGVHTSIPDDLTWHVALVCVCVQHPLTRQCGSGTWPQECESELRERAAAVQLTL
jgi:hypothetical protein